MNPAALLQFLLRAGARVPSQFYVEVPIKFHVLHDSSGRGRVAPRAVQAQVDALNRAFSGQIAAAVTALGGYSVDSGVRFRLDELIYHETSVAGAHAWLRSGLPAATTLLRFASDSGGGVSRHCRGAIRTAFSPRCAGPVRPEWFAACTTSNAFAMQSALAVDPARFLNIYTCLPAGGVLGWVTRFPSQVQEGDVRHGVFAMYETLPGGAAGNYNLGMTIVHEGAPPLRLLAPAPACATPCSARTAVMARLKLTGSGASKSFRSRSGALGGAIPHFSRRVPPGSRRRRRRCCGGHPAGRQPQLWNLRSSHRRAPTLRRLPVPPSILSPAAHPGKYPLSYASRCLTVASLLDHHPPRARLVHGARAERRRPRALLRKGSVPVHHELCE